MAKKDSFNKERRNSLIGGLLTAGGLWLLFHPGVIGLAIIVGVAVAVGKTVGVMSSGLDTTPHNRDDMNRTTPVQTVESSGNEQVDQLISQGQEMLREIRAANDAIPDPELSRQMYELEDKCVQIFRTVSEKPASVGQIRKFMSYYLPTTLKMLRSYRQMADAGVSEGDLANARVALRRGMDTVLTACQKQLDNLYRDTMLDFSTDIEVMEQMLKRDGFVRGDLDSETIAQQAASAAAAQMRTGTVPTLHVEGAAPDEGPALQNYFSQNQK